MRCLRLTLALLALLGALATAAGARTVYVANQGSGVSAIDSVTNRALELPNAEKMIEVRSFPRSVAITPNGRFAYVAAEGGAGTADGVAVIDTSTNRAIEVPDGRKLIKVAGKPRAVAITPDGRFAYVATTSGVAVIDTSTNRAIEVPDGEKLIRAGANARGIAITPDGKFAYVTTSAGVAVIDLATNKTIEVPDGEKLIKAGSSTHGIAITPDGKFAYVADEAGGAGDNGGVAVINLATNLAIEVPDGSKLIKVGVGPGAVAITPDGRFAYVVNNGGVAVINLATNLAIEVPDGSKAIKVGANPVGVAITPDGRFAYVVDDNSGVAVIDTSTNRAIEVPDGEKLIRAGTASVAVAVAPNGRFTYVAEEQGEAGGAGGVSVIDTATNRTIEVPNGEDQVRVGTSPAAVAITPDGKFAYVADEVGDASGFGGVSVIDTATNQAIKVPNGGKLIGVGGAKPVAIAITPNGRFAYVAEEGVAVAGVGVIGTGVTVIDTSRNEAIEVPDGGKLIKVLGQPRGIAITPDGRFAYVATTSGVAVIDTATNESIQVPNGSKLIQAGPAPVAVAITPDGRFAYVADEGFTATSGGVSVIDLATNKAIEVPDGGKLIKAGEVPKAVAIAPDGRFAYVANQVSGGVSVIDLATNKAIEVPDGKKQIEVHPGDRAIAVTPDSRFVYVADFLDDHVSVIDAATDQTLEVPDGEKQIDVGTNPLAIAVSPDLPPVPAFTSPRARPGVPLALDASASRDPDSAIATYAWTFGDGASESLTTSGALHTFARPGSYEVTLKETDAEGCSGPETSRFTGQTASCVGSAASQVTRTITVAYPGVRVRCPKGGGARGCSFKLQVIARKPKKGRRATVESAVARAKLKAGDAAIVSLKPRKRFASKLASAHGVLVRETTRTGNSTMTRYAKLEVVQ